MSFPRANIGRWGKGRGENIAIFLTLISTSHVEQLCSSLSQTNYSMIVGGAHFAAFKEKVSDLYFLAFSFSIFAIVCILKMKVNGAALIVQKLKIIRLLLIPKCS